MKLKMIVQAADESAATVEPSRPRRDFAASLAFFLLEKEGSIFGTWDGRLRANEQRELFGRFIGKGRIIIDGANERLTHTVTRCFGRDYEDTVTLRWAQL